MYNSFHYWGLAEGITSDAKIWFGKSWHRTSDDKDEPWFNWENQCPSTMLFLLWVSYLGKCLVIQLGPITVKNVSFVVQEPKFLFYLNSTIQSKKKNGSFFGRLLKKKKKNLEVPNNWILQDWILSLSEQLAFSYKFPLFSSLTFFLVAARTLNPWVL